MKNQRLFLIGATFLAMSISGTAHARCFASGGSGMHYPGMKEISQTFTIADGGNCRISRRRLCGHCSLTALNLVSQARHGRAIAKGFNAIYKPAAGFRGVDTFTARWCETPAEKGCYLAHYTINVP